MDKVVNMRRYKAVSLGAVGCIAQISELGAHSKKNHECLYMKQMKMKYNVCNCSETWFCIKPLL